MKPLGTLTGLVHIAMVMMGLLLAALPSTGLAQQQQPAQPCDPTVVLAETLFKRLDSASVLITGGGVFAVNNATRFLAANGEPLPPGRFFTGMPVRVEACPPAVLTNEPPRENPLPVARLVRLLRADGAASLQGPVESLNDAENRCHVEGVSVRLVNSTVYRSETGQPLTRGALRPGLLAKVQGRYEITPASGQAVFTATLIILPAGSTEPPTVTIEGEIVAIPDAFIQIYRAMFTLTGSKTVGVLLDAEAINLNGGELDLSTLRVGDRVLVSGVQRNNILEARRVQLLRRAEQPQPGIVEGPITAINPVAADAANRRPTGSALVAPALLGTIVVRERTLAVTTATEIVGPNGPLSFTALVVGDVVAATFDSASVALRIAVRPRATETEFVEVRGMVESVDDEAATLVVRGVLVRVGETTDLKGIDGAAITLADIEPGDYAVAKGVRQRDNSIAARLVRLLPDPTNTTPSVVVRGAITELGEGGRSLVVSGRLVTTDDQTIVRNQRGERISAADLQLGQQVVVEGTVLQTFAPPAPILARAIKVERDAHISVEVVGTIAEKGETTWVVTRLLTNAAGDDATREAPARVVVALTPETVFQTIGRDPLTAADFAEGDRVHVRGDAVPGAPIRAAVIVRLPEVVPPPPPCRATVAFGGPVISVDTTSSTLVVGGRTVLVGEDTVVARAGEGRITLDGIAVGELAQIEGRPVAEGVVVACAVTVREAVVPPTVDHRVLGRIDSIDTAKMTLVVRDRTIAVTNETRIVSRRDAELGFDALAVGQFVEAIGRLTADSVLTARLIRVQEENVVPNPPQIVRGRLAAKGERTVTIGETLVAITTATRLVGVDDRPVTLDDFTVGDAVSALVDPRVAAPIAPAIVLRLHAQVIGAVDVATSTVVVGGDVYTVTGDTRVIDRATGPITVADLAVGDLVHIRVLPIDIVPPQLALLVRVSGLYRSEPVGDFEGGEHGTENGRPTIRPRDPNNSFAFVSSPLGSNEAEANTLYEVRMTIGTNIAEPLRVPVARVRANMANWSRGATLDIVNRGSLRHVPTLAGVTHSLLFVPPVEIDGLDDAARRFSVSLDMLAFDPNIDPAAVLRLENVSIAPVSLDRVRVVATHVRHEFQEGTDGWEFAVSPQYTAPRQGQELGGLVLAPSDRRTFGAWTCNTGITARPGAIYRGRYIVRADIPETLRTPAFRVRLNTSRFELASTVNIEPAVAQSDAASPTARAYDVYLAIPETATGEEKILASFDILAFGDIVELDTALRLELFQLEEVVVDPAE